MADKARYYLEQSVPELKELLKKNIFDKAEVSAITKKRSEFEHKVNAPGCKPTDYEKYADFEMNFEKLRKKRVQRLGVKDRSHTGQRKIFFILDRATRKFHGDVGLWMKYIDFAKKEKASKVLLKVFASALKMHPMRPELWIYAARNSIDENGDMTEGRSFMQRGLRFNKNSKQLWLEYTKLELVYIAKIITRRRLLGIDGGDEVDITEMPDADQNDDSMIEFPTITAEEMNPEVETVDRPDLAALDDLEKNPALNGAIPLAVFGAAMKEIPNDIDFIGAFFNLFASFPNLHCLQALLEHVTAHALSVFPTSPLALFMDIRVPLAGIEPSSPAFISCLSSTLSKISTNIDKASSPAELYQLSITYLLNFLKAEHLNPTVGTAIKGALNKYFKQAGAGKYLSAQLYSAWAIMLESSGKKEAAKAVLKQGKDAFPGAFP
ncbi:U3 small nucleolar RNA-associated protein 6-domain-containing protein [Peziza echinospora]|nr:U3 small nucleolar RNA-associated protein 6-domain-containing protein [Peziza echinospora]